MSENASIQSSLFETMKIFSEYAAENSGSTTTIEGIISEVIDAGAGEYKIEYLGNSFAAHANNDTTYSVGDSVYILIPDNDFTKEKIILGSISASARLMVSEVAEGQKYYDVSDNLVDAKIGTIKLSSYRADSKNTGTLKITNNQAFATLLQDYLKTYRTFQFGFSVKTTLALEQQCKGDYGIILNIPILKTGEEGKKVKDVKNVPLEIYSFEGDPYHQIVRTPQSVYFSLDSQYEFDSEENITITYFCKGFPQDESKENIIDIELSDVFLKVVNLYNEEDLSGYHLVLKASEGEYFAKFYKDVKKLTPIVTMNGKKTSIKDAEIYWFKENIEIQPNNVLYLNYGGYGWECLNDKTNVVTNADGTESFEYINTIEYYEVASKEVCASTRFKCVIVMKDKVLSSVITLKNLMVNKSVRVVNTGCLSTSKGVTTINNNKVTYYKDTGMVSLSALVYYEGVTNSSNFVKNITCSWARYDKDGSYINDAKSPFKTIVSNAMTTIDGKGYYVTQVQYPVNMVEEYNLIYCTAKFISSNGTEEEIGTVEFGVGTTTNKDFNITINGDNVVYKYDVDGDSPMGVSYDGPPTSKITSITPLSFTIRKLDGSEFTESEYNQVKYTWIIPKKSLFTLDASCPGTLIDDSYYRWSGYGNKFQLFYKIASRFDTSLTKIMPKLTIEFGGHSETLLASVAFFKEGMSGTNGTAYSAMIVTGGSTPTAAESVGYGAIDMQTGVAKKLKFLYNSNSKELFYYDYASASLVHWNNNKRLYTQVWRDSELLTTEQYTVKWSMFDETATSPCFAIGVNGKDGSKNGYYTHLNNSKTPISSSCNIVQAEITVTDGQGSSVNANQIIYAYYPIELTVTNFKSSIIPSLDGGFAEVMYASDGTNPKYDTTNNFIVNDNEILQSDLNSISDYYSIQWDASKHLGFYPTGSSSKQTTFTGNEVRIKPDNKYDDASSLNYVRATLRFDANKEQQLKAERDAITKKKNTLDNRVNELNKNLRYLDAFKNAYRMPQWIHTFEEIQKLLDEETVAYNCLKSLGKEHIQRLNEYFELQSKYDEQQQQIQKYFSALRKQMDDLTHEAVVAQKRIVELDGSPNHRTSDLINLERYMLDEIDREALRGKVARDLLNTVYLSVQSINDEIRKYQDRYTELQQAIYDSSQDFYYQIKQNMLDMVATIGNDASTEYVNFKNTVWGYIKNIDEITSIYEVNNLLHSINNIITSIIYTNNDDGSIRLSDATKKEFDDELNSLKNDIDEYTNEINSLTNILNTKGYEISHIRPIILYLNRYEMSEINGWDGNKLEIGDNYLLARKGSFGIKHPDNSFTGIISGVKIITKDPDDESNRKGVFGFNHDIQTFSLDAENGAAIFGKAGTGQVIIDPNQDKAMLYSSNYWLSDNYNSKTGLPNRYTKDKQSGAGMLIDLSGSTIHLGSAKDGKIYSGDHDSYDSTKEGFFLNQQGLSIGTGFNISSVGVSELTHNGSNLGQWRIREVTVKDVNGNDSVKQCITSSNDAEGVYLDAANSTIVLGSSQGRIYSGQHYYLGATADGFYLSQNGLSIGKNFTISASGNALINEDSDIGNWKVVVERDASGAPIQAVDANNNKLYIDWKTGVSTTAAYTEGKANAWKYKTTIKSKNNTGILLDSNDSRIVLGSSTGQIYSGTHSTLNSYTPGFYISNNGLSISSKFFVDANTGALRFGEGAVRGSSSGKNYWDFDGYTNAQGYSVSYMSHGTWGSNNSVYVATDQISLGNQFCVTSSGVLTLGAGATKGDSTRHWTIDSKGNGSDTYSYIGYNADSFDSSKLDKVDEYSIGGKSSSVYIGTNGIRLGKKFAVDNDGNLIATHLIANDGGYIGGWGISSSGLESGNIKIEKNGSIKHTGGNWSINQDGSATFKNLEGSSSDGTSWKINRDGSASFSNVTITGGSLTIKKNNEVNAKIDTNGDATFNNITATGTINATGGYLGDSRYNAISASGLNFNFGGMALGLSAATVPTSASGNGIYYNSSSGLAVKGNIYANDGHFKGTVYANAGEFGSGTNKITLDANGNAVIPGACIDDLEVSKIKDSNGTKKSETVTWKSVNSITGMSLTWNYFTSTYKLPTEIENGKVTDYDSCSNLVGGKLSSNNKTFDVSYTYKEVTSLATTGTDRTHTVT